MSSPYVSYVVFLTAGITMLMILDCKFVESFSMIIINNNNNKRNHNNNNNNNMQLLTRTSNRYHTRDVVREQQKHNKWTIRYRTNIFIIQHMMKDADDEDNDIRDSSNDNTDNNNANEEKMIESLKGSIPNKKRRPLIRKSIEELEEEKIKKKQDIVEAVGDTFRKSQQQQQMDSTSLTGENINESSLLKKELSIFDRINPYKVGQNLRKTIDETLTSITKSSSTIVDYDPTQSIYYLDDRFLETPGSTTSTISNRRSYTSSSSADISSPNMLWEQKDYIPEVLVIGATGDIGRFIVRRLLLTGRCRVRVLVRDLYTKTLNLLGTGVTYCQGDLLNIDSLQYALTDVDKIIFCISPPDTSTSNDKNNNKETGGTDSIEEQFHNYMKQNLIQINNNDDLMKLLHTEGKESNISTGPTDGPTVRVSKQQPLSENEIQIEQLQKNFDNIQSILHIRGKLAEQIDYIGMSNLIRAYQDVRHTDYGTSQAAKRSLFKFNKDRPDDFYLFEVDNDDNEKADDVEEVSPVIPNIINKKSSTVPSSTKNSIEGDDEYNYDDEYEDDESYYDKLLANDEYNTPMESRSDAVVKTQTQWIRNRFDHGVFVGRIPMRKSSSSESTSTTNVLGGEASIISTRLRSRDNPDNGIDLGGTNNMNGFVGFIVRLCSDGGTYEAFVRTGSYIERGIEYVCEFSTLTKSVVSNTNTNNKKTSKNKFQTIRLPFENFKPIVRSQQQEKNDNNVDNNYMSSTPFKGRDVRHVGFRYRTTKNDQNNNNNIPEWKKKLQRYNSAENPIDYSKFYLALSYIKLYRSQPEPEIVYVSDARIPPIIKNGMVRHNTKRLVMSSSIDSNSNSKSDSRNMVLLDDSVFLPSATTTKTTNLNKKEDNTNIIVLGQSPEETYYKYRGEEIIKNSGLSYAIVRVPGYNDIPTGESSTINLSSQQPDFIRNSNDMGDSNDNDSIGTSSSSYYVSLDEIAQVCVSAVLDPNALNKSFYVSKRQRSSNSDSIDDDMSTKFASLPTDSL